jgi:hypothetical protein
MDRGYGIEARTIGFGAGPGVAAVISFGFWLFLKAK